MNRPSRIALSLLAGVALIWLVQFAAAAVSAIPGLASLLRWLHANQFPSEILSPGIVAWLPVFGMSLIVGLVTFRLPERRFILFSCTAAPFFAYSLYMNVGMWVSAGSSFETAVLQPQAWLIVLVALLGLGTALLACPRHGAA